VYILPNLRVIVCVPGVGAANDFTFSATPPSLFTIDSLNSVWTMPNHKLVFDADPLKSE